ncbi:hypothetical protein N657DRAFT_651207 [Parathielavia appendiculata]|uniref:2EXR domain-containing protein n=1 Tax=Parathielavia appendiculata TaxID=2587402 RepID=A0AAN6YYQ8_9PEZI|nr:hypothetical protein N657DRAFT_651207 [Parathielavia appendiculata]
MTPYYPSRIPRRNRVKAIYTKFESRKASFKPFPRLPPELRQEIWRIAASSPATFSRQGVCILSQPSDISRLVVHEPRNRSLLATSTEARYVALTTPHPRRQYDPEIDILYIPRHSLNAFRTALFRPAPSPADYWPYHKIRHLALPSTEIYRVLAAGSDFLLRLFSLQTLTIVFPAPSGTVDYSQDVTLPPPQQSTAADGGGGEAVVTHLRRLPRDELEGITVRAAYDHETGLGTFPIRWTRSGVKYLQWVEATLKRTALLRGDGGIVPPMWNFKAGRLGIEYEGACFEAWPAAKRF